MFIGSVDIICSFDLFITVIVVNFTSLLSTVAFFTVLYGYRKFLIVIIEYFALTTILHQCKKNLYTSSFLTLAVVIS